MSTTLQEGTIFAGRYRIVRLIASGGMGAVYEVVHLDTERRRALKVMHPHLFQNEEMRERFRREAKVASQIESDFVVDVFDTGVDEATSTPFMVLELLRGEELGKRIKRAGPLPAGEVVAYLHQTALALEKMHRASIIHRDLKPGNLFLTEQEGGSPRVKVLDFGIAKIIAEGMTSSLTTQALGTPGYMAPEQFDAKARLTGATDIFALGMIAYTLLVGHTYWARETRGGNMFALISATLHGPKEPASLRAAAYGVTLSPGFDDWFAQVTAEQPADRFLTATAAVKALAAAIGVEVPTGTWPSLPVGRSPALGPDAPPASMGPAPTTATAMGGSLAQVPGAPGRVWVGAALMVGALLLGGVAAFAVLRGQGATVSRDPGSAARGPDLGTAAASASTASVAAPAASITMAASAAPSASAKVGAGAHGKAGSPRAPSPASTAASGAPSPPPATVPLYGRD